MTTIRFHKPVTLIVESRSDSSDEHPHSIPAGQPVELEGITDAEGVPGWSDLHFSCDWVSCGVWKGDYEVLLPAAKPLEAAMLLTHPDELTVDNITYLADRANAAFLAAYEATWAHVIDPRRTR